LNDEELELLSKLTAIQGLPFDLEKRVYEYSEVLSKLKKAVIFRGKPPNSIAQNRELGGKYSDERSEKRALSVRPD
jgi:hypothetical protein